MRLYWFLPIIAACTPFLDGENADSKKTMFSPVVVLSDHYSLEVSDGLRLAINCHDRSLSSSMLRQRLFLIKEPKKDQLARNDLGASLPLSVVKTDQKHVFHLRAKDQLVIGARYGLFFLDQSVDQVKLIYSFIAKGGLPKLLAHDLGEKRPFMVDDRRILFSFTFDQPIVLHDDQAIRLTSGEGKALEVASMTVEPDGKTVVVRLVKEDDRIFSGGANYAFSFGAGLKSVDGESLLIAPLEFMARAEGHDLVEMSPVVLSTSHDSVEIEWMLNEAHFSHLFLAQGENDFILREGLRPIFEQSAKGYGRWFLAGLNGDTPYKFLLHSEDKQGRIMVVRGNFRTTSRKDLRISEIMINPVNNHSHSDNLEYIEVVNDGASDISLADVHITIEDIESKKVSDCALVSPGSSISIGPGRYFLIVAKDFTGKSYDLEPDAVIIRLDQKRLCGGLSNFKRKVIKLHQGHGHFIDRYGGYKWKTKKGQSVQRIDLKGLDEDRNYCYSKPVVGPTPGKINGLCDQ